MPNRIRRIHAAAFVLSSVWQATALTFDAPIILKMPARVDNGATLSVGAVNLITDLAVSSAPSSAVERDSLHVGFALPAGWEVLSVSAHPAFGFRPARASVNRLDTNYRNQLLLDSLDAYAGRADTLVPDLGLEAYVKGRSYRVTASPDSLGKSFTLRADSVPKWFGFKLSLGLSIPAGVAPDTVLGGTAVKQIPVFVYAVLKTSGRNETASPVLFVKSGSLDTAAQSGRTDLPALVYRPLEVGLPVSALKPVRGSVWFPRQAARDAMGRQMRKGSLRILFNDTHP